MAEFKVGDRVFDGGEEGVVAYVDQSNLWGYTVGVKYPPGIVSYCKPETLTKVDDDEPTPALRKLVQDHQEDVVAHPSHYTSLGIKCKNCNADIECIDVVEHMNFNLGNVVKYAWRVDSKDEPIENLKKARQYLDFEISRRERESSERAA